MKKADIILFIILIALAALLCILPGKMKNAGYIEVTYGGKTSVYDLSKDETIKVSNHNTIVIKDGKAHMESADCPDKICVKKGEIYRDGETIVCLPNHLYVVCVSDIKKETDN